MRIRTKQRLLATLREDFAYSGNGTLEDVLKYLKDEAVKIDEEAVKALFNKSAALEFDAAEDETEEVEEVAPVAAKTKTKAKAKTAVADDEDEGDGEDIIDIRARREDRVKADKGNRDKHAGGKTFSVRSPDAFAAKAYNVKALTGKTGFSDADEMTEFNAAFRVYTYHQLAAQHPHVFAEYRAKGWLEQDEAILTKDASDTLLTAGGALIANTLKNEVLWATEEWGVSRYLARNEIMVGNNTSFPRKTALPTMAALSAGAAQSTDITYDLITLIPKVCAAIILTPMVLFEQSATNLGDVIAESLMEAYWNLVDDVFFNGTGTAAFLDQVGLKIGLTGGGTQNTASTQQGSYWTASTNAVSTWTTADFLAPMSLVQNLNTSRACWVMSRQIYVQGPLRLATAATTGMIPGTLISPANTFMVPNQMRGNAPAGPRAYLLGEPVFFSQRMSTKYTSDAGVIKAYYGDFVTGSLIGHRTSMEISSSTEYAFNKRALATRGFAAFAVNFCGDGRATSTQCGPICALSAST